MPPGFVVVETASDDGGTFITAPPIAKASSCPGCGILSDQIHSRYQRHLTDLPIAGRPVRLMCLPDDSIVRLFCARHIFAERFDAAVLACWARRTARLEHIVHHLGLALGGRTAASFARRLTLPVSNDTLLRAIRRHGSLNFAPPAVIGIDDWAWRRSVILNAARQSHSCLTASLQRSDGRTNHEAQARETPDVWPWKARSPPGPRDRYCIDPAPPNVRQTQCSTLFDSSCFRRSHRREHSRQWCLDILGRSQVLTGRHGSAARRWCGQPRRSLLDYSGSPGKQTIDPVTVATKRPPRHQ